MSDKTVKQVKLSELPQVSSSKDLYTIGIENGCYEFDESKSYEIGEYVKVTIGGVSTKYKFIAHHDPGELISSQLQNISSDDFGQTVKVDLSFISEGMNRIDKLSSGSNTLISGNRNNLKTNTYTVTVTSSSDDFDVSGVTIKASSDIETLVKKTDSDGECTFDFFKDRTYTIEAEEKTGWVANTISGRRFTLTPIEQNIKLDPPEEFDLTRSSSYGYKCGDTVSYNDSYYTFTANHSGAWTTTDISQISKAPYQRLINFNYTPKAEEGTVNITMKMQYEDGTPLSNIQMVAMTGDPDAFNLDPAQTSGLMYGWFSLSGDINGTVTGQVSKDKQCEIFFRDLSAITTLSCHNTPSILHKSIVSDRDQTITSIVDSGIKYVCGETDTSIADGTAWKEFSINDFPIDEDIGDNWENGKVVNGVQRRHPAKHPLALIHVATDELLRQKFDHSDMELSVASGLPPSGGSAQKFEHKYAYDASYYIRAQDLTDERGDEVTKGRQWCTQNLLHPHVTTCISPYALSAYDGPLMTSWMKYDSENLLSGTTGYVDATSPAADYALSCTYQMGSRKLNGFIGTYMQMNPLFQISAPIYEALAKFGYVANYKTGTYWWSATQIRYKSAWFYNSSVFTGGTDLKSYSHYPSDMALLV